MAMTCTTHSVRESSAAAPPLIHGDGTSEDVWNAWLSDEPVAVLSLSELVPAGCRLVVVAPHPDDEILACGGLLAACVQNGKPVCVLALTDGDASHGTHDPAAMRSLAAVRRHESAEGLRLLGVGPQDVVRWHLPDGQLSMHQAEIAMRLTDWLAPNDIVLTTWCADGHPDHDAAGRAVLSACQALGCRSLQAPVWMWHWAVPNHPQVPWSSLVGFAVPAASRHLKALALQCHRSQLAPDSGSGSSPGALPILGSAICERAGRGMEYFWTSVDGDGGGGGGGDAP